MNITQSEYVASYPRVDLCPNSSLPEYAFIGRSNVGKSSLINMLTGRKNLAKTSGQPGKTQKLNYFLIDRSWYIVDLPGIWICENIQSATPKMAANDSGLYIA